MDFLSVHGLRLLSIVLFSSSLILNGIIVFFNCLQIYKMTLPSTSPQPRLTKGAGTELNLALVAL